MKISITVGLILLFISSIIWGYFEGRIFQLSKTYFSINIFLYSLAFLILSVIIYAVGLLAAPINLGLWIALWEIGAFVAAVVGSTGSNLKVFNETVFLGWIFAIVGTVLLTVGWDLLYGEYINP